MKIKHQVQEKQATKVTAMDVLGMVVTEIDRTPAMRSGMKIVAGLIVKMVRWGGVADQAGVATGDIISEINGRPVRTFNDLNISLAEHECQEPIRFLFRRVGGWRFVAIPFEAIHLGECSGP